MPAYLLIIVIPKIVLRVTGLSLRQLRQLRNTKSDYRRYFQRDIST